MEDATLRVLKKKMKLNPGYSLIEFNTGDLKNAPGDNSLIKV